MLRDSPASWPPLAAGARFTQPRDHSFAQPCIYLVVDRRNTHLEIREKGKALSHSCNNDDSESEREVRLGIRDNEAAAVQRVCTDPVLG